MGRSPWAAPSDTDERGRINFVNEAAERMHGFKLLAVGPNDHTAAYSLHTDAGDPHPPESLPVSRAVRERLVVKGAIWKIGRRDGTVLRVRGTAKPVFGTNGQLLAGVLTLVPWPDRRCSLRPRPAVPAPPAPDAA